ncbi:hypothetical protein KC19_1G231800 [Ceratodon purpureus]|uniref:Translation initiation factor IF-2, mitochondrial n=1 Tax=Ceratodon purpureus TaxID=3225 RepID=A0A8T0JAP8_CERPU|nr:hypothetical protein KC19_1G231800 [Ceratodon purpureus]
MATPCSWRCSSRPLRLAKALAERSFSVRDSTAQLSRLLASRNGDILRVSGCAHDASTVPSDGLSVRALEKFSRLLFSRLGASRCCGDGGRDGLQGIFGLDLVVSEGSGSRVGSIRVWGQSGFRGFRSSSITNAKVKVGPSGSVSGHRYKGNKRPNDKGGASKVAATTLQQQEKEDVVVNIFSGMSVEELAARMRQPVEAVKTALMGIGEPGFQAVSADAAELVALEYGMSVKKVPKHDADSGGELPRSPVVTVMGHVDHGKTTLLDALRQTSLAAREAGGITQHLGAFVVAMPSGASLTFLDTPGHAAFSSMRARGTAVTDIVVLVVAADDGVMPQTLEAMSLARDAGVPVVVALTKCDRVEANPARVRQQLAAQGVELEEIGGDVQVVEVSAVEKSGLEKLEDALLLQAELMELRASSDDELHAVVVEARLDRGRGPLATVVVRSGNLVPGAIVVIGAQWGRIRVLKDMLGRPVASAGPSTPVEIDGLRGLPEAGDYIQIVSSEERARKLSQARRIRLEEKRMWHLKRRVVAAEASAAVAAVGEDGTKELASEKLEMALIVKADVQGTAEAVSQALNLLSCTQVEVNIVHSAVGPVSQSDIDLAASCRALIVGFNVGLMGSAIEASARLAKVTVLKHRVIYHLLEDVGALIVAMAPGVKEDQIAGQADVLSVFELKGKGRIGKGATKIAGCRVVDGRLERAARIRVLRSGEVLFEGLMQSLKREQQDVDTVEKGVDCGMIVDEWVDFKVGDVIQCITDFRRMPKFISTHNGSARIEC